MVYQLWTSPLTGYRRRGTSVTELRRMIESLTVRAIYEPLRCCSVTDPSPDIRLEMGRLGFDALGVRDPNTDRVLGFILAVELEDTTCDQCLKPFTPADLIADSIPLLDLVPILANADRRFVLVADRVRGIVTTADLQKPPVRILLFGLISLFEMHIAGWVRQHYQGESWKEHLQPPRLEAARRLWEQRRERKQDISEFDCLQLCDKRDLLIPLDAMRDRLGLGSKSNCDSLLTRVETLRNNLAHSQPDLAAGESWAGISATVNSIEQLLHRSEEASLEDAKATGQAPRFDVAV